MTPVFAGHVSSEGKLRIEKPMAFRAHIARLRERHVEVIVRRKKSQRSIQANNYYWGVVVPMLGEEFGYEKNEMHEVLAMNFLRIADCPLTGAPRRKRTPDCDSSEFAEYVDACIRLGAEYGVDIPAPNEHLVEAETK